jgi:transcriptional regulator of acetoin/glycerol metabolism
MHATDFSSISNFVLVRSLTAEGHRPNLLVLCTGRTQDAVIASLMTSCAAPFHLCTLPGPLQLPVVRKGTLFLNDAAAMTLSQQIALNDWMGRGSGDVQIISVTSEPLWPLVEQGAFLEGLFYRLNVICLEAKPSDIAGRPSRRPGRRS